MFEVIAVVESLIDSTFLPAWIFKEEFLVVQVGDFMFVHEECVDVDSMHGLFVILRFIVVTAHLEFAGRDKHHSFGSFNVDCVG